jgi:dephospho-CoA kinase
VKGIRIGVTGPIGCGKSTIAGWLGDYGLAVIDADDVAREVIEPGTEGFDAVVGEFGGELITAGGCLDRAALGRIVFSDPEALRRLERIVHPAVRPKILERVLAAEAAGTPGAVIEAIKLVEGGLATFCDEVWLVVCDPGAQRERLAGRGLDAVTAAERIAAQDDPAARLRAHATRVIDTTHTMAETHAAVERGWMEAVKAAIERSDVP